MSIFSKLFKRQPPATAVGLLSPPSNFTPWSGGAWENDIYRAAVDAIARNAAKLKGVHIVKSDDQRQVGTPKLNHLLQTRWNPYMSAYDAIYRVVTHYYLYNNAFAYLKRNKNSDIEGIYPFKPASVEMGTSNGIMYMKCLFSDGNSYTLPYSDIVHLRRHFNDNDLLGDTNAALMPALELAHTQNQGIIQGIKTSAHIRGLLKFPSPLTDENIERERSNFMRNYMQMNNNGGIIATDTKAQFVPLDSKPYVIDEKQIQATRQKIFSYLGITDKIVESSYDEDEYNAFYESVIEPFAVQFSLEFTAKTFTERERAFGNEILFEAKRVHFASLKSKTELLNRVMPMGLLSVNEAREILGLPSIEDGDKRIVSLNFVNAARQDEYQLEGINRERTTNN